MDEFQKLKGLEALACVLGYQLSPRSADSALTSEVLASATDTVDSLEGLELIYYYWKSLYLDVIGDPKSAFAVFDERSGALKVFAKTEQLVNVEVFPCVDFKWRALEGALKGGATFHTCDGQPTCVSSGFPAHGADFATASMRAWLKESINTR